MSDPARRAVVLCMAVFLAQPIHLGLWLSRIAEVQVTLGINKAELALALLGMPIGLLPALFFAGRAVERMGPRRALIWAFPPMLLVGAMPGFATNATQLFLALVAFGAVVAFSEVGLNVFAAQVEKVFGRKIMNRAHGFWSLGIVVGSFTGVQLASLGMSAQSALVATGVVLLPILLVTARALPTLRAPKPKQRGEPTRLPPIPKVLVLLSLVVLGATIVEGAMNDWATVYMREAPWGGTSIDGLAVTVFAGMVTVGRFLGDALNTRLGTTVLARICLAAALAGIAILVVSDAMWFSFLGFGLVGFGVSTIFPLGISACAALDNEGEARNVSLMTFGALLGFLIGPPLIGFVAEQTSINTAIALLIPPLIFSFVFANRLTAQPQTANS